MISTNIYSAEILSSIRCIAARAHLLLLFTFVCLILQELNRHQDSLLRDFDDFTWLVGLLCITAVMIGALIWIFFPGMLDVVRTGYETTGKKFRTYEKVADVGMELPEIPHR